MPSMFSMTAFIPPLATFLTTMMFQPDKVSRP